MGLRLMMAPVYAMAAIALVVLFACVTRGSRALGGFGCSVPDGSLTRFWLFGVLPVALADGPDHHRSAFGRLVTEAESWEPASLFPGETVSWDAVDDNTARATVRYGAFRQSVDVEVKAFCHPTKAVILRRSNKNSEKVFRDKPFGGTRSECREFEGCKLPNYVEGGDHFGIPDDFPFFKAEVARFDAR
ncbi:DUF6544 family protein [Marivita hallyeonensis]|uniref:Uncharacterized protein n=1 Tax=Marivita hallyeonensis TaxID=996342 RepID=A0A1M5RVR1_9RHOB|nr:DUF6544 family protein [Marivita hallyeonensis]SHH30280.1 hypothetical protein SAMN05443551_1906 [Marivita hallyeonensis]